MTRTQDVAPARDKPQCGETLDEFFLYSSIVQQREIVQITNLIIYDSRRKSLTIKVNASQIGQNSSSKQLNQTQSTSAFNNKPKQSKTVRKIQSKSGQLKSNCNQQIG